MMTKKRCSWCTADPVYIKYHDEEWGRPVHDDRLLFEFLILEGAQAGLNWLTVLKKRENYRQAFDGFDVAKIARYDATKVKALLNNAGIIRNRLKINATIANAKAFLDVCREYGCFDAYLWQFVEYKSQSSKSILGATSSAASIAMSKDMRQRGFRFVGPTICYAWMQAVGMVADHQPDCFLSP